MSATPNATPAWEWPAHTCAAHAVLSRFHQIPESVREDLVQDALIRALEADEIAHPRAYLCRIVTNLAVDWLRRRREIPRPHPYSTTPCHAWQAEVEERLVRHSILRLLLEAPPSYRSFLEQALRGEELEAMVARGCGDEADDKARARARDALYKRRRRALAWLRDRIAEPAS